MHRHHDDPPRPVDAWRLIYAAALAALPIELLLRAGMLGLNLPLAALMLALAFAATRRDAAGDGTRLVLCGVGVLVASIAALRAPSLLWLAMVVACVATLALVVLPDARALWRSEPLGVVVRAAASLVSFAAGPLRLLGGAVSWRRPGRETGVFTHVRGLAWSVPVVLPFVLLFASADPVFARFMGGLVDVPRLATHVALWGVFAWLTLGWLAAMYLPLRVERVASASTGARETVWVLGALVVVFDLFVALQLRWFFGGEATLEAHTGLTYAEYARRGFFELVAAGGLLLGVLLVADWLTRGAAAKERRNMRLLSCVLLALLGVVLASALMRMRLYVAEFGLTQLRFFTTAFMLWLVVVFGWFAATVLRGRAERFAAGVYATGVAAVLLLAAIDPIGRIAEFNVRRAARTGDLDVPHLLELGADAAPVLARAVPTLPEAQRCPVAVELTREYGPGGRAVTERSRDDWRAWNLGEQRARAAVERSRESFERLCGPIAVASSAS